MSPSMNEIIASNSLYLVLCLQFRVRISRAVWRMWRNLTLCAHFLSLEKMDNWLDKSTAWNVNFNASCLFLPPTCLKHLYFSVGTLRFWKGCWDRVRNVVDCGPSQPGTTFRTCRGRTVSRTITSTARSGRAYMGLGLRLLHRRS